jgi:hypothetical protein
MRSDTLGLHTSDAASGTEVFLSPFRRRGRLFAVSQSSRGPFFFEALNCDPQPVFESFFDLVLIAVPIE